MPKLIVTNIDNSRHEFPITQALTIGRGSSNQVQIADEKKASRAHCRVYLEDEKFYIEDLKSSNGTKVNGQTITKHQLKHGDLVVIGDTTIVFDNANPLLSSGEGGMTMILSSEEVADMNRKANAAKAPSASSQRIFRPASTPSAHKIRHFRKSAPHIINLFKYVALLIIIGVSALIIINRGHFWRQTGVVSKPPAISDKNAQPVTPLAPIIAENSAPTPTTQISNPTEINEMPKFDPGTIEELTKVFAERDRALSSGNLLGARVALTQFLAAHPNGDLANRANQQLKETESLIHTALSSALKDAQKAVEEKNCRLAMQRCTRLLSFDPIGKFGAEARQLLMRLDDETEPRFKSLSAKVASELKASQIEIVADTLTKAVDELSGTKWGGVLSGAQLQVVMTRSLLKQLENKRQKESMSSKAIPITITNKNIKGNLAKIYGLTLEIRRGAQMVAAPIRLIETADFTKMIEAAGLAHRHLELACLWQLLDRKDAAQMELAQALRNPEQALAATAAALIAGATTDDSAYLHNMRVYDFSKWQQQCDWEALSGSWSTQDGRYVLESNEGGDTALKSSIASGVFTAKNARIGFDFELLKYGTGYFFSFELGTERQSIGAIFSEEGATINSNISGVVTEKVAWARGATRVEIIIAGDTLTFAINGQAAKNIPVSGLSSLTGSLVFHARETTCAIDNVMLAAEENLTIKPSEKKENSVVYAIKAPKIIKAAPKIDGILNDEAWKEASVINDFKLAFGETAKSKTNLYIMQDNQNLYIAMECFENAETLKSLKATAINHDQDAIWSDDDVELFIDPSNKRVTSYQIIINSKGVCWDGFYGNRDQLDKTWEPKYDVAVNIGKDRWTVEIAIPFIAFDRSDKSEAEWAFNAARSRSADAEFIYWSPVFAKDSFAPEKFGKLTGMPVRALK